MLIEKRLPLADDILENWKTELGNDFEGYRNHVYRMINFCLAFNERGGEEEERQKIIIAGCFHDLGIWSDKTFDYLPPSIALAKDYLEKHNLGQWTSEIGSMIDLHHKIGKYQSAENPLIEVFRKGDLVDFSLGLIKCGLPKSYVKGVKREFPNAGFHFCLARLAGGWILKHPLNPVPVLKW